MPPARQQGPHDGIDHRLGQLGAEDAQGGVLAQTEPVAHREHVGATEGLLAGRQLVEGGPQGEDVHPLVEILFPSDLLWGGVAWGAHGDAGAGEARASRAEVSDQAEVCDEGNQGLALGLDEHVGGLEIPVQHACGVGGDHPLDDAPTQGVDLVEAQGPTADQLVEVEAASHVGHDDGVGVVDLQEVGHPEDVGMVEAGLGPSLQAQALDGLGLAGVEHLDGVDAAQDGVPRSVDRAHAAGAQRLLEDVALQLRADLHVLSVMVVGPWSQDSVARQPSGAGKFLPGRATSCQGVVGRDEPCSGESEVIVDIFGRSPRAAESWHGVCISSGHADRAAPEQSSRFLPTS